MPINGATRWNPALEAKGEAHGAAYTVRYHVKKEIDEQSLEAVVEKGKAGDEVRRCKLDPNLKDPGFKF